MEKVSEIATATLQTIVENFKVSEEIATHLSSAYAKTMANGGKKL